MLSVSNVLETRVHHGGWLRLRYYIHPLLGDLAHIHCVFYHSFIVFLILAHLFPCHRTPDRFWIVPMLMYLERRSPVQMLLISKTKHCQMFLVESSLPPFPLSSGGLTHFQPHGCLEWPCMGLAPCKFHAYFGKAFHVSMHPWIYVAALTNGQKCDHLKSRFFFVLENRNLKSWCQQVVYLPKSLKNSSFLVYPLWPQGFFTCVCPTAISVFIVRWPCTVPSFLLITRFRVQLDQKW